MDYISTNLYSINTSSGVRDYKKLNDIEYVLDVMGDHKIGQHAMRRGKKTTTSDYFCLNS